jgi:DMSO/TMAO reductase YedYZ molybdopterin-dependent catalytic subunit
MPHTGPAGDAFRAVMLRPLTRRAFLFLLGAAGLEACTGDRKWSVLDTFPERTVESPRPSFHPDTYRLAVDGLVRTPLSLTYEDLLAQPMASQTCDFRCVEGWGLTDVPWEGVQLRTLMTMATPSAEARFVTFHCLGDVYQDSLSVEQAQLPGALLAYRVYNQPLPAERGRPLRLVFPKMLGYKGAKWVTRVEFTAEADLGFWERFGYEVDPWVEDEQPCRKPLVCGHRPHAMKASALRSADIR